MRLNFYVQGEGFPLILLHGMLGSADNWRAMGKRLAAHWRVYAVDLRNHGASPHGEEMSYAAMAEDLGEFMAGENIEHSHLLGHSMGGKVALRFSADQPRAVAKLVIIDIAPHAYPPKERPLLAALKALDLNRCASYGEAEQALAAAIPDRAVRQFLVKNLTRGADGSLRWRIGLDEITAGYDRLIQSIELSQRIATPTCFIRAGKSRFIADADIPAIERQFTNLRIVNIAGASHWVHSDAPEEFYRAVTGFLLGAD